MARTSTRQAAQKAKEAISSTSETGGKAGAGEKRKALEHKAPAPKKEKKEEKPQEPKEVTREEPPEEPEEKKEEQPPEPEAARGPDTEADGVPVKAPKEEEAAEAPTTQQDTKPETNVESGIRKSEEREDKVASNVLEKGIIYFFFRPRVNIEDPQGMEDVSRSFFVLRPTPLGAELDSGQGPVDKDARCRLLMLPKKKFPTSGRERDMGFVEKANQSMKDLQEKFFAGSTYQTSTRGERHIEEARPYAEGVYALTSTRRATHLAYVLTIPSEVGEIQDNFGLDQRGSFIVQSKNPKFPGPSFARLPKEPEYPQSVLERFDDLRWVPLQPEFIEYPNAQFLMIGEAQDSLGKAATAEGRKQSHETEPGEELEKMEHENEDRIHALEGDSTIFRDLGLDAKKYAGVPTTWGAEESGA
ncbi:uncharacterized protein N7458_001550 [Penicillium daleae]|uniref:BTB domain transcription factor n=1 Tax=Penicillium daleae TaxID=63821 RepID=A0AAD6G6B7_9EURO|nr:uncharacterized protein N7458_001550 [Penicillium daleae]KAJ5459998.1 hypothetical protein N7458_001550 [Penicillium daleae]